MRKSKIVYIFIFFMIALLFLTVQSFGFSNGDKVQCKVKSFWYTSVTPGFQRFVDEDGYNHYYNKGQVLTYIRNTGRDGIWEVEDNNGNRRYLKGVNLVANGEASGSGGEGKQLASESGGNNDNNDNNNNNDDNENVQWVQCKVKSFWYKDIAPAGFQRFVDENNNWHYYKKGQILKFIRNTGRDGIWVVEDNSGNRRYLKGVNLVEVEDLNSPPIEGEGGEGTEPANTNRSDNIPVFQKPSKNSSGDTSAQTLDDMIGDADSFINSGHSNYNEEVLQNFSQTMYNILLAVGVAIAVIVGGIIGIKFMTETSAEGKAEVSKLLVPYIAGCIIVFGGFTIWKIVVNILSGM